MAPAVRLSVVVCPPVDLVREIHVRHVHLCVNGAVPQDEDFVRHELFDEEFRLYVGRCVSSGPVGLESLTKRAYGVVTRVGDPYSERLAARLPLPHRAVALGLEAVATLIAGGRYVGYLPVHYAALLGASHALSEVTGADELHYSTRFDLNYERSRPLTAPGRRLRDLLCECHRSGPVFQGTASRGRTPYI